MSDLKETLERIERRVAMPEPALDRMLRRREHRERRERIAAAAVGLGVAAAGILGAIVTLRVAGGTSPTSGGGQRHAAAEGGGFVLPTVAIWTALVVLGLTGFAVLRLRARFADIDTDMEREGREPGGAAASARTAAATAGGAPGKGGSDMDSKQRGEVVGLSRAEMPEIRLADGKLRRTNRWLVGAVIVLALAVMALGGALIVTSAEEAAPAPPAEAGGPAIVPYTAGPILEAEVTFDGTRCSYSGPTEVAAGTDGVFRFTGPGSSGLTLASLAPGVTWEQVEGSTDQPPSNPPSWVTGAQNQIGSGTLRADALDEGLYFVGCATGPTSGDQMFPAVMLRVIGA